MTIATLRLPSIVTRFERRWRGDHQREHGLLLDARGQVVTEQMGDYDSIDLDPAQLEQARGGTLSHTHPRSLPPSGADVVLAAAYGLTLRAVGIAPDSGQSYEYTLSGVEPDDGLLRAYDDEVERAEKELARQPYSDLQWQRESRHLALTRLAARYGFIYRQLTARRLSETTRRETIRLSVLSSVEPTLKRDVFSPLHANIVRSLVRHAVNGSVPMSALHYVQSDTSGYVQRAILGSALRDGSLASYTVQQGVVVPRSAYFAALWHTMHAAAQAAINYHAALMRKYLPPDLTRLYEFATLDPFDRTLSEMTEPQYDPLHLWLGEDGKRLSDRIWNVAGDMRRKLDEYLTVAIAQRKPVSVMEKELEQYLVKGAGGYEARRLAHTETSAAGWRADFLAAQGNPFAETYNFFTAPSHQCCDECDTVEAGSPYPKDDIAHLPPRHPFCICGISWNIAKDPGAVVVKLRRKIEQAVGAALKTITDFIGPLSRRFIDLLFRGAK